GLVFGGRAGRAMVEPEAWSSPATVPVDDPEPDGSQARFSMTESDIRALMWEHAGVHRDRSGLEAADRVLSPVFEETIASRARGAGLSSDSWKLTSLVTVATLIVRAALRREESRGAHWRADHPERDDLHWK